jgi:hypothetical protein
MNRDDIHLPCRNEKCDGKGALAFAYRAGTIYLDRGRWKFAFVSYACRNCMTTTKTYALAIKVDAQDDSGIVRKLGEIPTFGPDVPAPVISLIGPDRELFLKGRRAENHGLGVGAFAYYRRVVENQKGRIIQELAKVAAKLGASTEDLKHFDEAAKEVQFTNAVDRIKDAIPSALLIDGHHNPLTLLHEALSDGLHDRSDEECLELATEIRLMLTHLAERMAEVLKSDAELKGAVSKLLKRVASKNAPTAPGKQ